MWSLSMRARFPFQILISWENTGGSKSAQCSWCVIKTAGPHALNRLIWTSVWWSLDQRVCVSAIIPLLHFCVGPDALNESIHRASDNLKAQYFKWLSSAEIWSTLDSFQMSTNWSSFVFSLGDYLSQEGSSSEENTTVYWCCFSVHDADTSAPCVAAWWRLLK